MRKALKLAAAAASLFAATTALAVDLPHKTTAKIKSVDLMRHVVTLDDGSVHKAARGVNLKRVKPGEKVLLTLSRFGGTLEILSIAPAPE
jgi:Cu/Ag efflux protein CusF